MVHISVVLLARLGQLHARLGLVHGILNVTYLVMSI